MNEKCENKDNCFCWAVNLVLSLSRSAMISFVLTEKPSPILRLSGSVTLTVMFNRLGVVAVSVCVPWLVVARLDRGKC
ncbi:MAG: hypothetical protein RLZZ535_3178 [Cyanobacteriota bacterium]